MKKQLSLLVCVAAMFGMSPVWAATNTGMYGASSADLTGAPAVRTRTPVNYEKYETRTAKRTYTQRDADSIYYTQPARRSDMYKQYSGTSSEQVVRKTRSETVSTEVKRKYYLAHPFFQPMKGKFGSVMDLSYLNSGYDVAFTPFEGNDLSDKKSKSEITQFAIKEDLSFGITDRLAVMGMLRYDSTDYKMDWSLPETPDDKMDDSGVNLYGLGLQWRFADNSEWIATLSGYYQRQVDTAHMLIADIKAGYKIASSTIYGLARGWYMMLDENSYGNVIGDDKSGIFLAYQTGDDTAFYIEGGLGIFSVLDEDWTLNLEAVLGNYDWHNQASIKAAIGWQPGNAFALNLYGKTSIYDSADGKSIGYWVVHDGLDGWTKHGRAKLTDNSEWTIGLQAIFYF